MTCPFCMNQLLEGATVCGHCRAFATTRFGWLTNLLVLIGAATIITVMSLHLVGKGVAGIALLLFGGLLIVVGIKLPKRTVWTIYHGRS
jgi:hypothetical protein